MINKCNYLSVEDNLLQIDITALKRLWYLWNSVTTKSWVLHWNLEWKIVWTAKLIIEKTSSEWVISLIYKIKGGLMSSSHQITCEIDVTTTTCNFWGVRWWFICPQLWIRCKKLYLSHDWYYSSRQSLNMIYRSQKWSKSSREWLLWHIAKIKKAEKVFKSIKYTHRKGIPTRKMISYLKLMGKLWTGI